jgi:hypothetical protein
MRLSTWIFWPVLVSAVQAARFQSPNQGEDSFDEREDGTSVDFSLFKTLSEAKMGLVERSKKYRLPALPDEKSGNYEEFVTGDSILKVGDFLSDFIPMNFEIEYLRNVLLMEDFIDAWYWILQKLGALLFKSDLDEDHEYTVGRFKYYRNCAMGMEYRMLDLAVSRVSPLKNDFVDLKKDMEAVEQTASSIKGINGGGIRFLDRNRAYKVSNQANRLRIKFGNVKKHIEAANESIRRMSRLACIIDKLFASDEDGYVCLAGQLENCHRKMNEYQAQYKDLYERWGKLNLV